MLPVYRDGMLDAAQICKNEFAQAPDAARGHDSVWMGGYESACDHLAIAIEQASVIACTRVANTPPEAIAPEWTDLACSDPESAEAVKAYHDEQIAQCEDPPTITATVEEDTVRIAFEGVNRTDRHGWDMQLLGYRDGFAAAISDAATTGDAEARAREIGGGVGGRYTERRV